jgi:hypothetical protein
MQRGGWAILRQARYLSCAGRSRHFPGGVISTMAVTYTVEVIASGSYTLTTELYGFTNSSYQYNGDLGQDFLPVQATAIADEDSFMPIVLYQVNTETSTSTPTSTGTLPTHTATAIGTTGTPQPPPLRDPSPPGQGVTGRLSRRSSHRADLHVYHPRRQYRHLRRQV